MKILVFSDSHGVIKNMTEAIDAHYPNIDLIIHLGDGAKEFDRLSEKYREVRFFGVRGNCDLFNEAGLMTTNLLELDGYRILCTHGHEYKVKYTLDNLHYAALEKKCNIALFGHTHSAYKRYDSENEIYLFNPGSISRGAPRASYGLIELTDKGILLSHAYI